MHCSQAMLMWHEWVCACPLSGWPLTFPRPSIGLAEALQSSVNEVDNLVEWRAQSDWKRSCQCVKGCWLCGGGLAPPTQEVGCVVVVIDVIVCLLVLTRLCCTTVCGLPEAKFLREWTWWCCGCVLAPPIKCTLPALAATPLQWNESGWLSPISLVLKVAPCIYAVARILLQALVYRLSSQTPSCWCLFHWNSYCSCWDILLKMGGEPPLIHHDGTCELIRLCIPTYKKTNKYKTHLIT